MEPILGIVLRSVAVYIFIVLAIRFFGKKEIAQLSVVDLVFILLISNSVQNAMVGDNSTLLGGLVAATALFLINALFKILLFRSKKLNEFIQGSPLMLIYRGRVMVRHLKEAQISMDELEAAVREHGAAKISDVDLAVLEVDGNISVLSENFRRETVRRRRAHKVIAKNQ
ncbi:DUF421 domain-containing protein [Patescibacteria group bacterium]|nr:DUF421 domain-containing protein [Patescibacteria group bacterium]